MSLGTAARALSAAFALCLLVGAQTGSAVENAPLRAVSTLTFNWDGHPDVRLTFLDPPDRGGPGDFTQVRVAVPGHEELVLNNVDAWTRTSDLSSLADHPLPVGEKNLLPTDYLWGFHTGPRRTTLLLFGAVYGCCLGGLDALEITPAGAPRLVLHLANFGLIAMSDLDGDGYPEMVGFVCLAETFGDGHRPGLLETYSPRDVFKFGASPDAPAQISTALSKRYNTAHYYGWAGPSCSETDPVIVHPPGGKPYLLYHPQGRPRPAAPRIF